MVIVSRRNLLLLSFAALIVSIVSSIFGFLWLHPEGLVPQAPKLAAERLLFIGIVGELLLIGIVARIFISRISIEKKLERISTLGGTASPAAQLRSSGLGALGETLEHLFRHILEVNEKQALKLSAQSELIELLIAGVEAPVVLTDITGRILYLSDKYEKRSGELRSKLLDASIESFEEELVVPMVVRELEQGRFFSTDGKSGEAKSKGTSFTALPIYNKLGGISYILFDFRLASPFRALKSTKWAARGKNTGNDKSS